MMSLHLRDDCEYAEAQCPICEELLRRRDVVGHIDKMHGEENNAEATKGGGEGESKDDEEEVCIHLFIRSY